MLIKGCGASEGVSDGVNGLLIKENAQSLADCLLTLANNKAKMREIGANAARDLYISWEDSVKAAMERYDVVIDRYRRGEYPNRYHPTDGLTKINGQLMRAFAKLSQNKK